MSNPILHWSATELVQSFCGTSLKLVELNFVVSVLLVEQFPSWNVAHQQYLRSLVHSVPHDLWGYCHAVSGWTACLIQGCCLCRQVDSCLQGITRHPVFKSALQLCWISPERPGLAYRQLTADHTPRYAQSWKQLLGLTVALFLRLLFSLLSWFGLVLLFPLLS